MIECNIALRCKRRSSYRRQGDTYGAVFLDLVENQWPNFLIRLRHKWRAVFSGLEGKNRGNTRRLCGTCSTVCVNLFQNEFTWSLGQDKSPIPFSGFLSLGQVLCRICSKGTDSACLDLKSSCIWGCYGP